MASERQKKEVEESRKIIENQNLEGVRLHIENLQSIIQRMAENSTNCKKWCIAIVSAMLSYLASNKGVEEQILFALLPIGFFYLLDGYYLYLERHFKKSYGDFVSNVNSLNFDCEMVYVIKGLRGSREEKGDEDSCEYLNALMSMSVSIFYIALGAMVFIINHILSRGISDV